MDLKSLQHRIARLRDTLATEESGPLVVAVLPENHRTPDSGEAYPRVQRTGNAATIVYRLEDGAPDSAAIAALLGEAA